jgi:hypothetical protein
MNDVSTPKSKRKIDLSVIVEEENDTELPDILNTTNCVFITFCFKGVFRVKAESGAGSNSIS